VGPVTRIRRGVDLAVAELDGSGLRGMWRSGDGSGSSLKGTERSR
jgi:hypothetical protein